MMSPKLLHNLHHALDREHIHSLINTMDDVADLIQDSAETMALYDVRHMTDEITRLTDLCVRCCERLRDAVKLLDRLSDPTIGGRREQDLRRDRPPGRRCRPRDARGHASKLFREEPDVRRGDQAPRPSMSCWKPSRTAAKTWRT